LTAERGVGFDRPADVLKDPTLELAGTRAILSPWASDASAVQDEPAMRWLLGTPNPAPPCRELTILSDARRPSRGARG
jgi:hypothetical protein